jgi:DNA modification methylase
MDISEQEREEIINSIRQGRPLPARYRASLFEDALEAELIWPGKSTDVERTVLPFQSIEHIDEPREETVVRPTLFSMDEGSGRQTGGWTNKLIWGDNKLILSSLVHGPMRQQIEEAGGLKLVYIDPPFDVGANFSVDIEVGDQSVTKEPSIIEEIAYRDTWGSGSDSFLSMIYPRLQLIKDLLAPDGSVLVHVDHRLQHYMKVILDEIFGKAAAIEEIIWYFNSGARSQNGFGRRHNTIFRYAASPGANTIFNDRGKGSFEKVRVPYSPDINIPASKAHYYDEEGKVRDDVWTIPIPGQNDKSERTGYPTQKPERLLDLAIAAYSNPGDLVADFFCGSGTTLAVAEKLDRKWIGVDLGRFAVHTSRKRVIGVQRYLSAENRPYRAFEILNLGSYERQYFVGVDMSLPPEQREASSLQRREQFLNLILSAYGADRSEQMVGFHGIKENACVFVGPLDAPVTEDNVRKVIEFALKQKVTRVDVLGFEFEMGIKPAMSDEAKEIGITMTLRTIPNDVFDKRVISRGQAKFFDVGYLEVKPRQDKSGDVSVELSDFGVFYAQEDADSAAAGLRNGAAKVVIDGGQVVRVSKDKKGIAKKEVLTKQWADWIDYWAVDFDFESQKELIEVEDGEKTKSVWTGRYIFENEWQDFRTKTDRKIKLISAPHTYDTPGEYKIAVKVVDVFGNDTTKVVKLKVK